MTTLTSKRGMTVETPYTNEEAIRKLRDVPGTFAADLLSKAYSRPDRNNPGFYLFSLSADQVAWVHKLVVDHEARNKAPETSAPVTAAPARFYGRIIQLFKHAAEHKTYPKIRLTLPSGETLKLQLCGDKSKHAGSINVTDNGSYPDNKFWGRIAPDGAYTARNAPDEVLALLDSFNADPAAVAKTQGEADRVCIFCCKDLDTVESRAVGYGPVCAKSYGLPWDARNNRTNPKPRKARKSRATGIAASEARNARKIVAGAHDPARAIEESSMLH